MNVFISSVIGGLEAYRDAAAQGIATLGHTAKRSEDYGASPSSPQAVCLEGVREADCVVVILGERYGDEQPSGLSAAHEEYREARERVDVLAFIQRDVSPEPPQEAFINDLRDWQTGHFTDDFGDEAELRNLVTRRLADLQVTKATTSVEPEELLNRARELTVHSWSQEAVVSVIVVPGPTLTVLPPSEMDDREFRAAVQQQGQFGDQPILERLEATDESIVEGALVLTQRGGRITVQEDGSIRVDQRISGGNGLSMQVLIEEQVARAIENAIRFAGWLLDRIDAARRLSHVAITAGFVNCQHHAWRTRAEHSASPNSVTLSTLGERLFVEPSRPVSKRAGLLHDTQALVEDIVARLKRLAKTNG